jgi:hypothetical protein
MGLFDEKKTRHKKSHDTVPLRPAKSICKKNVQNCERSRRMNYNCFSKNENAIKGRCI